MATKTPAPTTDTLHAAREGDPRTLFAANSVRTPLLIISLLGALAWNAQSLGAASDAGAPAAPPLTRPAPRCGLSTDDADELLARGRQLASAARARIDRYPFRAAEGLPALAMLGEAAACTAQAGVDGSALEARARTLRAHVESDYRDRVLRVERALRLDEPHRVRADIETLVAQLEGEDHAFARRMRNLRATLADGVSR